MSSAEKSTCIVFIRLMGWPFCLVLPFFQIYHKVWATFNNPYVGKDGICGCAVCEMKCCVQYGDLTRGHCSQLGVASSHVVHAGPIGPSLSDDTIIILSQGSGTHDVWQACSETTPKSKCDEPRKSHRLSHLCTPVSSGAMLPGYFDTIHSLWQKATTDLTCKRLYKHVKRKGGSERSLVTDLGRLPAVKSA